MEEPKKTVGLMVKRIDRYGTEYVDVSVMVREDDGEYPRGMPSWYAFENKPYLDGLSIRGSVHVPYRDDGPPTFYSDRPEFYDLHSVGLAQSKAMTATLTKVAKQVERDNAREPGDVFLALARAVGSQWVCVPHRDRVTGGAWRDTRWIWYGLTDGRNMYRSVIEGALREAREAQADRLKPVEPVAADLAWHAPASSEAAE
jgi:hypothetical protein